MQAGGGFRANGFAGVLASDREAIGECFVFEIHSDSYVVRELAIAKAERERTAGPAEG